ncbi:MAG: hypothetical protein ACOYWZ_07885 [Bacillota bacterium]
MKSKLSIILTTFFCLISLLVGQVYAFENNLQSYSDFSLLSSKAALSGGRVVYLRDDGTVAAWGRNDFGQCNAPAGLSGVKSIVASAWETLALKTDGTVVEWGMKNLASNQVYMPAGLTNVKAVFAGYYNTAALKEDGTLVVWGDNYYGQCNIPGNLYTR